MRWGKPVGDVEEDRVESRMLSQLLLPQKLRFSGAPADKELEPRDTKRAGSLLMTMVKAPGLAGL